MLVAAVQFGIEVSEEVGLLRYDHRVVAVLALLLFLIVVRENLLIFLPIGGKTRLCGPLNSVNLLPDYLSEQFYSVIDRCLLFLLSGLVEYRRHGVKDRGAVGESSDAGAEPLEDRRRDVGGGHLRGGRETFFVKYDVVVLVRAFDEVFIVCRHNDVTIDS